MSTREASRTLRRRPRSSSGAFYPTLHPGPGLPHEQVVAHQRARIFAAMIKLAVERGYGAVTVRELMRAAGVSPRSFYEHFTDKEHCFLATYELIASCSLRRVDAAQHGGCGDWREQLRLALCAWLGAIACEPRAAQLALVEAFAAGPAAIERMGRAEAVFDALIARSFSQAPDGIVVPRLVIRGIVAGIHRVARAQLLAGRADELPDMTDEILEWALCFRCQSAMTLAQLPEPTGPLGRSDAGDRARRQDDRTRIIEAVAWLAVKDGYEQLSVPQIRTAAGISRKRFDAQFQDVQECFLAALDHHAARALTDAATAGAAAKSWPGALHRALYALCKHLASDPVLARLAFVEAFSVGLDGLRRRARIIDGVGSAFRASAPACQRPSELAAEASVGAVWGILRQHISSGRQHDLAQITPTLSYLALAPALGAQQALEAITTEQQRMHTATSTHPRLTAGVR